MSPMGYLVSLTRDTQLGSMTSKFKFELANVVIGSMLNPEPAFMVYENTIGPEPN